MPSAWIVRWLSRLAAGETVLDVACGRGRHAAWLAARGLRVTAVDRDNARPEGWPAGVDFVHADLEADRWPFGGRTFDSVVVTHYLYRPLWPDVRAALKEGGVLLIETFARGQAHYGRPHREAFLLDERELMADACTGLHVLAFEDGVRCEDSAAADMPPERARIQRVCAVRLPDDTEQARRCLERWTISP